MSNSNGKKSLKLIILIFIVCCFGSWKLYSTLRIWDNIAITSDGRYRLSKGLKLQVEVSDGLVMYQLYSGKKGLLEQKRYASNFHNWALLWDPRLERLWFRSSDIGDSVHMRGKSGRYGHFFIVPSKYGYAEQEELIEISEVPDHIRQKFLEVRQKYPTALVE